jgi:hypothetical protein
MYAGRVKIVVHPMIQAAGKDADKVRGQQQAMGVGHDCGELYCHVQVSLGAGFAADICSTRAKQVSSPLAD